MCTGEFTTQGIFGKGHFGTVDIPVRRNNSTGSFSHRDMLALWTFGQRDVLARRYLGTTDLLAKCPFTKRSIMSVHPCAKIIKW